MNAVEDAEAIRRAVEGYARRLSPEDRWDVRQEVSTRLAARKARPESIYAWAVSATRAVLHELTESDRKYQDYVQNHTAPTCGGRKGYGRRNENWAPTWYPPHPDAQEYAPFAMSEARVMHLRPSHSRRNVEDVRIAIVDAHMRHVG